MTEYNEWIRCPKCQDNHMEIGHLESDYEIVWRKVLCENCGFEWREVFIFNHNESTDGDMVLLDKHGDPIGSVEM